MLACLRGKPCDPNAKKDGDSCGSSLAYAYFVSFIFFCSFLVSFIQVENIFRASFWFVFADVKFIRRCYNGQFRLLNKRFQYIRSSSSWWVRENLGGIRSKCDVSSWVVFTLNFLDNPNHYSGKIHYTEMYDMLKNMDPPLGFGNKCPNRLAYKKLIRMNMPMDADGKVNFTTTLFALIRENLSIKMRTGNLKNISKRKYNKTNFNSTYSGRNGPSWPRT